MNGQSLEDQSGTYMALINSGLIFSTRRVFKDKRTGCKLLDQNCQMFIFLFYALVGISSYSDSWMTLRLELSDKMNTFIFSGVESLFLATAPTV